MPSENEPKSILSNGSQQNCPPKDSDLEDLNRRKSNNEVLETDTGSLVSETIGHQIRIDPENTIQYRTCSWQKVSARPGTTNILC